MRIFQVDAFTDRIFAGNPAAVCLLPEAREEAWMQNVAREMNLSETAFLVRQPEGFDLRWFTPAVEVELCGHATLASAHVLWETDELAREEVILFHSLSGLLKARFQEPWIELDFPATPAEPTQPPPQLVDALRVTPSWVGKSRFDFLVQVDSEETVRGVEPDFGLLKQMSDRGLILTAPASSEGFDFVSRFFAPAVGIDEDPVTGSAHCCLAPHWGKRLGKRKMVGYQASARGGVVRVRLGEERVYLSGQAVTVLRAELEAPGLL